MFPYIRLADIGVDSPPARSTGHNSEYRWVEFCFGAYILLFGLAAKPQRLFKFSQFPRI